MIINWQCKYFTELSTSELYQVIKLRLEVFAVEQNCVYQDCDNRDQDSWHLMGWQDGRLIAYARLLPPGLAYDTPSIGRVVTSPLVRGNGIGKELMQTAISKIKELYGQTEITISAQVYLKTFYSYFNFHTIGDSYIEDEIEHIKMKTSQQRSGR